MTMWNNCSLQKFEVFQREANLWCVTVFRSKSSGKEILEGDTRLTQLDATWLPGFKVADAGILHGYPVSVGFLDILNHLTIVALFNGSAWKWQSPKRRNSQCFKATRTWIRGSTARDSDPPQLFFFQNWLKEAQR